MSTDKKPTEQESNKSPEELNKENINANKPADLEKSPGDPQNESDPHRGITDTPSQHEQLAPDDDDDSMLDEEVDDLDDIEEDTDEEDESDN